MTQCEVENTTLCLPIFSVICLSFCFFLPFVVFSFLLFLSLFVFIFCDSQVYLFFIICFIYIFFLLLLLFVSHFLFIRSPLFSCVCSVIFFQILRIYIPLIRVLCIPFSFRSFLFILAHFYSYGKLEHFSKRKYLSRVNSRSTDPSRR